ncbi:MAG: Gfo/Idh/MocA family oxidoreductase [Armatimonadetes bacterium]|nr:Gfo/Idh/MocA family oxidoreductase [Armatimonadota bacterium]
MRLVLVGGGGFGRYHLQAWRKHPQVSDLVVVGRNPARLAALAAEFQVATTTELEVIASADMVDICTPTDTHQELARLALDAGRPCVVEKPPCRSAVEAMALAAEAGPTPLYAVMNMRFSPLWRRARQLLAEGTVGVPRLSLWPVLTDQRALMRGDDFRADATRGGGALLDGAFHLAYLVPWVLGTPLRAVTAWAGQLAVTPPAGEDTGLAVWEHEHGVAQVTYSWAVVNPPTTPAATIVGDEATLLVPRSARQPFVLLRERQASELDLGPLQGQPRNDLANCLGHYFDAAMSHTEPEATWSEAIGAQQVIEATERAAGSGARQLLQ